ncbi:hypothetical protein V8F20_007957 [Naviculisporaceae sp. PSN 640]
MLPHVPGLYIIGSALAAASATPSSTINSSRPDSRGLSALWLAPIPVEKAKPVDWSTLPPPGYSYPDHYPPPRQPLPRPDSNLKTLVTSISVDSHSAGEDEIQALYSRVDWRNRTFPVSGSASSTSVSQHQNFITTPQNQGICASCWAFAVTALIESQVRIEHGIWSKRSESDIHDGVGASCESTGNAHETLAWVAGVWDDIYGGGSSFTGGQENTEAHGIADWACDPYQDSTHAYDPCGDRRGRATHIPTYTALGTIADQKRWLREYGPIVATWVLYQDFEKWGNQGGPGTNRKWNEQPVYRYDGYSGNTTTGNHIALVVGYDDHWGAVEGERAGGAWIIKNSWGSTWGDGGYVYFGYDECNIDGWIKYGISNVSPDPWSRKRHQSGNMLQSNNGGTHRNFELLVATAANETAAAGFTHLSRDGTSERWSTVSLSEFGQNNTLNMVGQPVIIGTSYNKGDFHALVRTSQSSIQHWALSDPSYSKSRWRFEGEIKTSGNEHTGMIDGHPSFVQADDSSLVMVVRHSDGSLREWRRPPPSAASPSPAWKLTSTVFAPVTQDQKPISMIQSGAVIQSNIGHSLYDLTGTSQKTSNLYTVALRSDGKMQLFWRAGLGNSSPSNSNIEWKSGEIFGQDLAPMGDTLPPASGPVMIQSFHNTQNETSIGDFHLAIVSPTTGKVQHWRRKNNDIHIREPSNVDENDASNDKRWELLDEAGGGQDSEQVKSVWALVQGSFDGRMHMVTEQVDGRLALWEWEPVRAGGKRWNLVQWLPNI